MVSLGLYRVSQWKTKIKQDSLQNVYNPLPFVLSWASIINNNKLGALDDDTVLGLIDESHFSLSECSNQTPDRRERRQRLRSHPLRDSCRPCGGDSLFFKYLSLSIFYNDFQKIKKRLGILCSAPKLNLSRNDAKLSDSSAFLIHRPLRFLSARTKRQLRWRRTQCSLLCTSQPSTWNFSFLFATFVNVVRGIVPWVPEVPRSRQPTILAARGWGRSSASLPASRGHSHICWPPRARNLWHPG